jgi:hypothetical protein
MEPYGAGIDSAHSICPRVTNAASDGVSVQFRGRRRCDWQICGKVLERICDIRQICWKSLSRKPWPPQFPPFLNLTPGASPFVNSTPTRSD